MDFKTFNKTFNKMHLSKVMASNILSYILPGSSGVPAAGAPLMETLNTDVAS